MRHLYLLRHAKSDWSGPLGSDRERPLTRRGRRAAASMGRLLRALGECPDLVLTSPAVRARSTVELAAAAGSWEAPIEIAERLYGGSPEELLAAVRGVDGEVGRLLLAGHEPVWSASVGSLIGGAAVKMVTAALARVDLPVGSWEETSFGDGTLSWLVTPRLLKRFGG